MLTDSTAQGDVLVETTTAKAAALTQAEVESVLSLANRRTTPRKEGRERCGRREKKAKTHHSAAFYDIASQCTASKGTT